ncbi:hypothetical protein BD414DRAFT_492476 [Trametes punicea]|nr:hypothetical protein BD414DRAFT_492476 [Trametes punicea]
MFGTLYIHPRPTVLYESPSRRNTVPSGYRMPRPPSARSTREAAVQASIAAEAAVAKPDFSCMVDRRGSFTIYSSEETYSTENVAEALRIKQRMKAWQALKSVAMGGERHAWERPGHYPLPSSSNASSPESSPPSTPPPMPTGMPVFVDSDRGNGCILAGSSRGRYDHVTSTTHGEERAVRSTSPCGGSLQRQYRPSRSRSSVIQRSLSRHSSRSSMTSASPVSATSSTSNIMEFVRRLAPLPRFNPYRRTRAESMTSIVDDRRQELGGALCGLLPRRRCKSEPSPAHSALARSHLPP